MVGLLDWVNFLDKEVLCKIQGFDPVGVACRDLKECLLIPMKFLKGEGSLLDKIVEKLEKLS